LGGGGCLKLKIVFRLSATRRLRLLTIGGGGGSEVLIFFPLLAARRLESLQMKNSSQNKKKLFISISECQSIQKTIEKNCYVPPHDMYNNQNTKLKLTSADTYKQ